MMANDGKVKEQKVVQPQCGCTVGAGFKGRFGSYAALGAHG